MTKITGNQIAAQQGWQTPTLGTGWIGFDGGTSGANNFGYPQYMKDSLGFVHIIGLVKNSSAASNTASVNQTIFTLPAGYRPKWNIINSIFANDSAQRVDVYPDGRVLLAGNPDNIPAGAWLSCCLLPFKAEY